MQERFKPALLVVDVHNVSCRLRGVPHRFKLEPENPSRTVLYRCEGKEMPVREGVGRTVRLIEFAKSIGIPVITTTFLQNKGMHAQYEIIRPVREALKKYPHSKHIRREGAYIFHNREFLEFLWRHGINALVLCGGEMSTCLLLNAKGALEAGLSAMASLDTAYISRKREEVFGDAEVGAFDDDANLRYRALSLYDPNDRRFLDAFRTDFRNLGWMIGAIEKAEFRDAYDRFVFVDQILGWAKNLRSQMMELVEMDADMKRYFESADFSTPEGLLGYPTVSSYYRKMAEPTVDGLIGAIREKLEG